MSNPNEPTGAELLRQALNVVGAVAPIATGTLVAVAVKNAAAVVALLVRLWRDRTRTRPALA